MSVPLILTYTVIQPTTIVLLLAQEANMLIPQIECVRPAVLPFSSTTSDAFRAAL